jgi:hypothetical protein
VAFSVPIWSGKPGAVDRQALGVLAMSVDCGQFGILQTDLEGAVTAVLVDLRPDQLEDAPRQGLILHHPKLQELQQTTGESKPLRLDDSFVDVLMRHAKLPPERATAALLPGFVDPLSEQQSTALAAFDLVRIRGRESETGETGWCVIVQEVGELPPPAERR